MQENGIHNGAFGADKFGLRNLKGVNWNFGAPQLCEHSLQSAEAVLSSDGALCADTGVFTGRSPKDKFTVRDATTDKNVWWGGNQSITSDHFAALYADFVKHAEGKMLFAQDLYGGADPTHRIKTRVFTELAWHSLFIRTLLIRPEVRSCELRAGIDRHRFTELPRRSQTPRLQIRERGRHRFRPQDRPDRRVILCRRDEEVGIHDAELLFTGKGRDADALLGQCRPRRRYRDLLRLVRHRQNHALGRPRAHADRRRRAWLEQNGIFNFEGGCYAKCIKLSEEAEPEIYAASKRFGAVLENVVLDPNTHLPDFDDGSKTENTRSAYPLDFIPNASRTGRAGHPKNLVMLAADAFGVMPPIAKLTPAQAMYHFLSGYTAKVAGTERGLGNEPQPEFSTCFASPFLPRDPSVYGNLLRDLIARHDVDCWLVNTGWTGGKYGTGRRMPIKATRALLTAALNGSLRNADFRTDRYFGFAVPTSVPGVEPHILDPIKTWADKAEFEKTARALVGMFQKNFAKFEAQVDADVRAAAPEVKLAAE